MEGHDPCCECCYEVPSLEGALSDSRHWAKETVLTLADLRAKVEEQRDFWQMYLDANPTDKERPLAWTRWDTLQGVLALLEEKP